MFRSFERIREYRRHRGTAYTLKRLGRKAAQQLLGTYDLQRRKELVSVEELEAQRNDPPEAGLISVVIPVWNTDPDMLEELLDTLQSQSYMNFEAVLYDGASTRPETVETLAVRSKTEPRFRVVRGEENRGISGNTNEAIRLARGEYVALCDHDDLLSPDALWRMAEVIVEKHPDMIYSDEDRVTEGGRRHMDPHYKPDYCPDNLVSDNYICHLAVIRRTLLEEAGGLRTGFDGSQDHDLFLRIAEKTDRIEHIPRVLYSWREVFSSKSHRELWTCLVNGCRAAAEHEAALGRKVEAVPVNGVIRLWYEVPEDASVEAIVHGGSEEACQECLGELQFRTDWPKLTGSLVVAGERDRIPLINEAARTSEADYLLVLLGTETIAQCACEGSFVTTGEGFDMMNKVHNVSAVSLCCLMVKRENWLDLDEGYMCGLAAADLGLRQGQAMKRFVFTPHARARLEPCPLLLSGKERDPRDAARFEAQWGKDVHDPCRGRFFH